MFKEVIYFPEDKQSLSQIHKEINLFRCAAVVQYIESLNLSNSQIKKLYSELDEDLRHTEVHSK